jgi:ABC-2 type transport system ATP-binding protein
MVMLRCNQVSKRYVGQGRNAVDALTVTVEAGEVFGFLGPNGAGKSTTIKMIVGLLAPDSGSIDLEGVGIVDDPLTYKSMIGYCADEPLFYEKMTGLEHLHFISDLRSLSMQSRQERIDELSAQLLLTDELKDPISTYSHGMRQKLSVIAALVGSPKLLILDEPMVGLDPKASFNLKSLLTEYARAGNTVFFSTHVLEVAQQLCTKLGIIKEGRMLHYGRFDELQQHSKAAGGSLEHLFLELTEDAGS